MIKRLALLCALVLTMSAPALAQDEDKIREIVATTLPDRINATDAKGVAALWSETGTHSGLIYGARIREGRESVQQMWATSFSQLNRDAARKVAVTISSVRFLRPDVAVVDAQNTYRGGVKPDGTPKPDTAELLFVVLTRENGTWLIGSSRVVPLIGQPR